MTKYDIDGKKSLFTMIMEDILNILIIIFRSIIAMLVLSCFIIIPLLFIFFKILSMILIPISGTARDITGIVIIFISFCSIFFMARNSTGKVSSWIMTGHIEIEISDESNRKLRNLWLKSHKGIERIKPINWKISLNNKSNFYIFRTIYPTDKFGHEEITKAPVCFQTLVPITHKFFGNLPVKDDTIHFSWLTTSNNDIKKVYVRAVEHIEKDETNSDSKESWTELTESSGTEFVCCEQIKTGKRFKISGTLKLNKKVNEKIQLCFWYNPEDAEGESVFRYDF